MRPIPFTLPDVGLREIKGNLFLDDEYLIVEIEDALVGEFDKDLQVIKVEPSALVEVRLDKGVIRDRLCIRPKKEDFLKAIPGNYGVEVPLRIWKMHRGRTKDLVEQLEHRRTKA